MEATKFYCQQQATPQGSTLYYSMLFADIKSKPKLLALFALQNALDQITDSYSEPHIAYLRLGWWREDIQKIKNKKEQHPISQQLSLLGVGTIIYLQELIDIAESLINLPHPEDIIALFNLCKGHAKLWQLTTDITVSDLPKCHNDIVEIGRLYRSLQLLRQKNKANQNRQSISLQKLTNRKSEQLAVQELLTAIYSRLFTATSNLRRTKEIRCLYALIMGELCVDICNMGRRHPEKFLSSKEPLRMPIKKLLIAYQTRWKSLLC